MGSAAAAAERGSEAVLSDALSQTGELSPAPQEQDVQEEAGNKLCSGSKHQQSGEGGCCQMEKHCRSIRSHGCGHEGVDSVELFKDTPGLRPTHADVFRGKVPRPVGLFKVLSLK